MYRRHHFRYILTLKWGAILNEKSINILIMKINMAGYTVASYIKLWRGNITNDLNLSFLYFEIGTAGSDNRN